MSLPPVTLQLRSPLTGLVCDQACEVSAQDHGLLVQQADGEQACISWQHIGALSALSSGHRAPRFIVELDGAVTVEFVGPDVDTITAVHRAAVHAFQASRRPVGGRPAA